MMQPMQLIRSVLPRRGFAQSCWCAIRGRVSQLAWLSPLLLLAFSAHTEGQSPAFVLSSPVRVGQVSAPQTLVLSVSSTGIAVQPTALSQGINNGEFQVVPGGTCIAGLRYAAGTACTVQVQFAPAFPGRRDGAVRLLADDGTLLGSAQMTGTGAGALPILTPSPVNTAVGSRAWIYAADGVQAQGAPIFLPQGLAADSAGNLFLADSNNNRIRRVDAKSGIISTIVGNGNPGYNGDGLRGPSTSISQPSGLVLDGGGNLYFADTGNHAIRRYDAVSGLVTTVAGTPGVQGYTGDGGPAVSARLTLPESLAIQASGDLVISDTGNNVIRLVSATSGTIQTIAGTGAAGFDGDGGPATSGLLNSPWGLALREDGSILFADFNNNCIRAISPTGVLSTIVGSGIQGFSGDNGPALAAQLKEPTALAINPAGDLFIADSGNNRVRFLGALDGKLRTFAGDGNEAFAGDGGPATQASLYGPYGLLFSAAGDLYISDMFHNRIRQIHGKAVTLNYAPMRVGSTSYNPTVNTWNVGNAALNFADPTLVNAVLDEPTSVPPAAIQPCFAAALAAGVACAVDVEFAPKVTGNPATGTVTIQSDAGGEAPVITLQGNVLNVEPTRTALSASANPVAVGTTLVLTAQISSADTSRQGTVIFRDGQTTLCTAALDGTGAATCQTSTLTVGQHSLTASYSGDTNNATSVSPVLSEAVKQRATLVLTTSPNPAVVTSTVTMRFTASSGSGTPSGNLSFYDGDSLLGSAALDSSGAAALATTGLSPGQHTLSAQYTGDSSFFGGTATAGQSIEQAGTQTTVTMPAAGVVVGSSFSLSAQVSAQNGPMAAGTVSFSEGPTALGTANVDSSGNATLRMQFATAGAHTVVATFSGSVNDAPSTSAPYIVTVVPIATQTNLSAQEGMLTAGAILHLSAAVTLPPGTAPLGTITGLVSFQDGGALIGTDQVDGNGHAVLAVPGLSVGTHIITATYTGSANYASSTSPLLTERVSQTATVTTLSSASTSVLAGVPVHLPVIVSSGTGTPTGQVSLHEAAGVLGQVILDGHGAGTFSVFSLSLGTHTLTAAYAGDANYSGSNAAPISVTVALAQPSLALAGPPSPADYGITAPAVVSLASSGATPTGTVVLRDGDHVMATQTLSQGGTISFPLTSLGLGTHVLVAVYSGDSNNAAVISSPFAINIRQAPTSLTLRSSANPVTTGTGLSLAAALSSESPHPGGEVIFSEGAATLGSVNLSAEGSAAFALPGLRAGTHTILATYTGDAGHAASSATLEVLAVQPSTLTLLSTPNPSISGTSVSFLARVSGAGQDSSTVPTGKLLLRDGTAELATVTLDGTGAATYTTSVLGVGLHGVTATYAGDSNYAGSTSALSQSVMSATTQIRLAATANPATYASPIMLSAHLSSDGGPATGRILFVEGTAVLASALLDANGGAAAAIDSLAPGAHTLVATYAGDDRTNASVSAPLVMVVKLATTVALASSSNPALTLSPVSVMASVSNAGVDTPTGKINFVEDGASLGSVPLDASGKALLQLQQLSSGVHTITASYEGDATNFAGQVLTPLRQIIERRPTSLSLTSSSTNASDPQQITLIAVTRSDGSSSPTGTAIFVSGDTTLGSAPLDGTGVATLTIDLQVKQESITATYSGDASYLGSTSGSETVTAGAATQFTLAVNPASIQLASKQHSVVTVALQSVRGFGDNLELGCLGLPFGATCTFSTSTAQLRADGSVTVQLTVDTGDPLGAGAQAGLMDRHQRAPLFCLLAPLALLGVLRKRHWRSALPRLTAVLLAVMLVSALSACSGLQIAGTPPGEYAFKVTASGRGTGATQSQTVQLVVAR